MKKIIISVSNDIVTDQRILKIAGTLKESGAEIVILGRKLKGSLPVNDIQYKVKRFKLLFNKKVLFYASLNLRLFIYLMTHKCDILISNDLDTLWANYWVSRLRKKKLVYDSHEYFIELPELVNRSFVRNIWKKLESKILPKLHYSYTVNESIAEIYNKEYNIQMGVIRNVHHQLDQIKDIKTPIEWSNRHIAFYAGVLNIGRGIDLVIKALEYLEDWIFVILGDGYHEEELRGLTKELNMEKRVFFLGKKRSEELPAYAAKSHVGIALEENMGLNYYYSLPNKLFTYIQAGLPILARKFPEIEKIVEGYTLGYTTLSNDPKEIAAILKGMVTDQNQYKVWKENMKKAAEQLCWEKESIALKEIYRNVGLKFPD